MRRIPIGSATVVGIAIAIMIALGVWQLHRRDWKQAMLAQYGENIGRPPIAMPLHPDDRQLFRRATADCPRVAGWTREGGRNAVGAMGWRQIATCSNGIVIQAGVARDPAAQARWAGGTVTGFITHAPDHRSLVGAIVDPAPQPLMLVADHPLGGLQANQGPDLSTIPNNHLAYAVQWFVFASIAAIIYGLALIRRGRRG